MFVDLLASCRVQATNASFGNSQPEPGRGVEECDSLAPTMT